MLIDVHSHLDLEQFDSDRDELIREAKGEDTFIIISGIGPEGIKRTYDITKNYDNVFMTAGFSPEDFDDEKITKTKNLIRKNKKDILAIGEIGLDYYWVKEKDKREIEKINLKKFIDLSKELNKPLVIHSRDAEQDMLDILEKEKIKKVLLHCFSGSVKQAKYATEVLGYLISIPTNVVYSKQKQKLVEELNLSSIVLETDAPFLAPVPRTRNVPTNVKFSARKISDLLKISAGEVEEITTKSAIKFFNLKL